MRRAGASRRWASYQTLVSTRTGSLDGLTLEVAASPVGLVVVPLVPVEGAEGLDGTRLFAARDELAQRDCHRLLLGPYPLTDRARSSSSGSLARLVAMCAAFHTAIVADHGVVGGVRADAFRIKQFALEGVACVLSPHEVDPIGTANAEYSAE